MANSPPVHIPLKMVPVTLRLFSAEAVTYLKRPMVPVPNQLKRRTRVENPPQAKAKAKAKTLEVGEVAEK